jgi:hypothetical protein
MVMFAAERRDMDYKKKCLVQADYTQGPESSKCQCECADCDKTISGNRVWYGPVHPESGDGDCYCKKCAFGNVKLRYILPKQT